LLGWKKIKYKNKTKIHIRKDVSDKKGFFFLPLAVAFISFYRVWRSKNW
jgi:hypothetical protein